MHFNLLCETQECDCSGSNLAVFKSVEVDRMAVGFEPNTGGTFRRRVPVESYGFPKSW
jgi:hypothetical protein